MSGPRPAARPAAPEQTFHRTLVLPAPFSLAQTCGPVAWVGHRSPRHSWCEDHLLWVGWEGDKVVWRQVRQQPPTSLNITTNSLRVSSDGEWARGVLGSDVRLPAFTDPVVQSLSDRFIGLRPYCDGSVVDGIVTAIIGQSISVAAAAVTQARLAALFSAPLARGDRDYRPLPRPDQLASASPAIIRQSGVTMRRAEALGHAARAFIAGDVPNDAEARRDPDGASRALQGLPLVGRWTAESALLWGIGAPDAYPTGDVALLRAARLAYGRPAMDLRDLDQVAERWRPARGLAARLLWTALFGPAPGQADLHDISQES